MLNPCLERLIQCSSVWHDGVQCCRCIYAQVQCTHQNYKYWVTPWPWTGFRLFKWALKGFVEFYSFVHTTHYLIYKSYKKNPHPYTKNSFYTSKMSRVSKKLSSSEIIFSFSNAKLFYKQGWSVGPYIRTIQIVIFVTLGMLELAYRFQTFRDYSFRCQIPCKKRSISLINTRTLVCPF